jgi:hypothetical protein
MTIANGESGLSVRGKINSALGVVGNIPNNYAENSVPGTTDMTAALEAAVAAGGTVSLLPQVYLVTSQFDITTANVKIIGYGAEIRRASTFSGTNIIRVDAANVTLEGFKIDGYDKTNQGVSCGAGLATGVRVRNLIVRKCNYGIDCSSNTDVEISGCDVAETANYSIRVQNIAGTSQADSIRIRGNKLDRTDTDASTVTSGCLLVRGTATYPHKNVAIANNVFRHVSNPTSSAALACEMRYCEGVFEGNTSTGGAMLVSVALSSNVSVTGNTSIGAKHYAIEVAGISPTGCFNISVTGNVIDGSGILRYAIGLQGTSPSVGVTLAGNTVRGTAEYCMYVNSQWSQIAVTGNRFYITETAGTQYGVWFNGSNDGLVFADNLLFGNGTGEYGFRAVDLTNAVITGNIFDGWVTRDLWLTGSVLTDEIEAHGNRFSSGLASPFQITGPLGATIHADGAEFYRANAATTGTVYMFPATDGIDLRDGAITAEVDTDPSATLAIPGGVDNVSLTNMTVNGNVTVTAGTRNWMFALAHQTSSDADGFFIDNCDISNVAYVFLKDNSSTGDQTRIRVTNSYIYDTANPPLLFNSPATGSLIRDILVQGNSFGSNDNTAGFWHRGTFAGHVEGGRVLANFFGGDGGEMWRAEEAARWHTISHNVANLNGEHGIEIIANNASGVMATPEMFTIMGNVLAAESSATGAAIHLGVTLADEAALHESVLLGNVTDNWDIGERHAKGAHRIHSAYNVHRNATYGIRASRPSLTVGETLLVDVTSPLQVSGGGMVGRLHIRSATAVPACPATMVAIDGSGIASAGCYGLTWETADFTLANGAQTYDVIPLGVLIDCQATIIFTRSSTVRRASSGRLTWDGTTLTYTAAVASGTGSVTMTSPLANNAGKLAIQVNNTSGGDLTGCRMQLVLDGPLLWTPA